MNRKAKNIIFWIVIGLLCVIFIQGFIFGGIKTIFEAGSTQYNAASKFIQAFNLNRSDFVDWSTYLCIGAGCVMCFMFYKKFNTRIN